MTTTIDKELFQDAIKKMTGIKKGLNGIGTLSEKTIHSVLKYYYAPNTIYHEQKIDSFVADICIDGEIFEIQTRSFNTMRNKLACFLKNHDVTIIYPIAHNKWIRWVDMDTGELSPKRKSPKTGSIYQIIRELYKIKMFLKNENLHFILCFIDVEEHRYLNGWNDTKKRGSSRADGFPIDIIYEVRIDSIDDFNIFLNDDLPEKFTSKDLKNAAHITISCAQTTLNILYELGIVNRIGKSGRSFLYTKNDVRNKKS